MSVDDLVKHIHAKAGNEPVRLGMILGSGLGGFADSIGGVSIDYGDLPGFPHAGVSGHNPKLVIATVSGVRIAILGGRAHYYENGQADVMRRPLELLSALGAEMILLTNAAGSLRTDIPPGELMLIQDHINFSGLNPLIGEPTDKRFANMLDAYDPEIGAALTRAALAEGISLKPGVYAWFSGPSFETPAEIRAAKLLGADAVGMSTVPEVILARFFGMKAAAISTITNMGAGLSAEELSHEHTKAMAPLGAEKLARLLRQFLANLQ